MPKGVIMAKLRKLSKKSRLAVIFSIVAILMLILVTPSLATTIDVTGPDTVSGGAYLDFWVEINIYECEQVPIRQIIVDITGDANLYVRFNPSGTIIEESDPGRFEILEAQYPPPPFLGRWSRGFTYCEHNWGYGWFGYTYCCPYDMSNYSYWSRPEAEYLKHMEEIHFGPGWGYGYGQTGFYGGCYDVQAGVVGNRKVADDRVKVGTVING